jgi:hypothetical protein
VDFGRQGFDCPKAIYRKRAFDEIFTQLASIQNWKGQAIYIREKE